MKKLTGQQYQQFTNALFEAFPAYIRLEQMLQFRLNKRLGAIAPINAALKDIVFVLIQTAEAEGVDSSTASCSA